MASRPLRARATTAISFSISSKAASAPSTIAWSSARTTRICLLTAQPPRAFSIELGQFDAQACALMRFQREAAAEFPHPLPHAAQPIPFLADVTPPVIGDDQLRAVFCRRDFNRALTGPRVAHDIGDRLAQDQGKRGLMPRCQIGAPWPGGSSARLLFPAPGLRGSAPRQSPRSGSR